MMRRCLAISLVACAAATTVHTDGEDPVVLTFLRTVDRLKEYLAGAGEASLGAPALGWGGRLASLSLTSGSFGNLSSVVIDDQRILEDEARDGSTVYTYQLWLHLDDPYLRYSYEVHAAGWRLDEGRLSVRPVSNTASVVGSVTTKTGSCSARLDGVELMDLDLLQLDFEVETWLHRLVELGFDLVFVYKSLSPQLQDWIAGRLQLQLFRDKFSETVCSEFLQ